MRLRTRATATAFLLFFGQSALAEGLTTSDGRCFLFCNSAFPQATKATPAPVANAANTVGQPVALHHLRSSSAADAAASGHRHGVASRARASWKYLARSGGVAKPSLGVARPQIAVHQQAATTPATRPEPAVTPARAVAESRPVAAEVGRSVAPTPEPAPVAAQAAGGQYRTASVTSSNDGLRLLAKAFAEHPQQAHGDVQPPERPTKGEAPQPPAASPTAVQVRRLDFAEMTANGFSLPRWPATLPGRTGVWLATLAIFATLILGGAKARERLYRRET